MQRKVERSGLKITSIHLFRESKSVERMDWVIELLIKKLESKSRNYITEWCGAEDREKHQKMNKNHENKDEILKLRESNTKSMVYQGMLQIVYNWNAQMPKINKQ